MNGHRCPTCGRDWTHNGCHIAVANSLGTECIECDPRLLAEDEQPFEWLDDFANWVEEVRNERAGTKTDPSSRS